MSTQYDDYLSELNYAAKIDLFSPNVDAEATYFIDRKGSSSTYTGDEIGKGQGDSLVVEDDGNFSTGFSLGDYMNVGMGDNGVYKAWTLTFLVQINNSSGINILWSGQGMHLAVVNGRICYTRTNAPSSSYDNYEIFAPFNVVLGQSYQITIVRPEGNSVATTMYVDNELVGVSTLYTSGPYRTIHYIGRVYDSTTYSMSSTSTINYMQRMTLFYYELDLYQVTRLAFLAKFAATPVSATGSIVHGYKTQDFKINIHEASTGKLISSKITDTNAFSEIVPDVEMYVVALAQQGQMWRSGLYFAVGDKVYPTQPSVTRYCFECTTAGTTGDTEPTWDHSAASATTNDGSIVWTIYEPLIQPIVHSPVIGV